MYFTVLITQPSQGLRRHERAIDQTLARRAARGNHKPFDPGKTLEPKFRSVLSSRRKLKPQRKTQDHSHQAGLETVVTWLTDGNRFRGILRGNIGAK